MGTNWIKSVFMVLANWIDSKLRTKSGRLTLIIVASLLVGASLVYAYSKDSNYDVIEKDKVYYQLRSDTLQKEINNVYKNADAECNEKMKESALLHQQLQDIYDHKTTENYDYAKEQEALNKQRDKAIKKQNQTIKQLNKLTNE